MTAMYYNPNIHPGEEYERRRATLESYASSVAVDVIFESYSPDEYWRAIGDERSKPSRCEQCYRVRLLRAALRGRSEGSDAFTTTLLISPYQQHELIRAVGEEVASAVGIKFHYEDYRTGYRESRTMAIEAGLYRQRYCGCALSLDERGRK